ncbi:hypothetical protein RI367_007263 [Sorochytrium milnesiophthora]
MGMRGSSVFMGFAATFAAPHLVHRIGSIRTGLWSIWTQLMMLLPVAAALYWLSTGAASGLSSSIMLFAGMALSRFALWSFDLAHTQILQEHVAPDVAGVVNGMHFAMCNLGDFFSNIMTIVWHRPSTFWIPGVLSVLSVFAGAVCYTVFARTQRHHLLHWERLSGCTQRN